ncbi:MAG: PIN domain-containing protein [Propionibacteriaceae bacterium]|jgi:predicted nucleic-acid-binding protein|nr:PIN domain-containing protein [Propionibacteriaceae bacterium]
MPSLDTNCLLRWLLADIPDQAEQVEQLLHDGRSFDVADEVVLETVFVLERQARLARTTVKDAINVVMSEAAINLERSLWEEVMAIYVERPKLSVADIYVAVKAARRNQTPLYTFDQKMINQLPGCAPPPQSRTL